MGNLLIYSAADNFRICCGRRRAAGRVADCAGAAYPARPVRIIVPTAPACASDVVARLLGQWLSERLG
jgi:tripartite-type tricarboxylate transporter receptor subunit TctC